MKDKKRVLVADDDPAILEVITFMLDDAGYDSKTTVDGHTEKIVEEYQPDVILLDIWMSGLDGRTICKSLKKKKSTKNIPIIMISANKDTETIARESGADDFLSKPFEMNDLLSIVAKYADSLHSEFRPI